MQAMPDGSIKFLSEEEVIAELNANPAAEIYSATGVRMKLEAGKIVGLPGAKDPLKSPPSFDLRKAFDESVFAYRRA